MSPSPRLASVSASVHINRTLQGLRRDGLVNTHDLSNMCIHDWKRLAAAGDFQPGYLRLAV